MRVLIVSPHAPPTNAADMQRVRMLLPYLGDAGIEAEVLSVRPEDVASPVDPWLEEGLPVEVPIHRVQALSLSWARIPGLGTLGFRALHALTKAGDRLLKHGDFDLVYFSTTVFAVHVLGPRWKKRFGVPFVMDYQDPWVSDYYHDHPNVVPPGGRLKYGIVSWINRRQEPRVLRECSGITSVSAAYPEQLQARYPWLMIEEIFTAKTRRTPSNLEESKKLGGFLPQTSALRSPPSGLHTLPSLVLPFPGDSKDLERVRQDGTRQSVFNPQDGMKHWVYVGRGGEDMQKSASGIFRALRLHGQAHPRFLQGLRVHFVGTSYAAAGSGRKTLEGLAVSMGLGEVVTEHTDRIPYSQAMRCLLDADALIVPGSDDPGYTASKIYPYLLAEKPLLAVFHEQSSVVSLIRNVGGGTVVRFVNSDSIETMGLRIAESGFDETGDVVHVPLSREAFGPHTARAQAIELVDFFRTCLTGFQPQ